jgi:single-stranded DNA-binding protein
MLTVRGIVVLTEPPTRRSTRNGAIFATARAVAPAIEAGTAPVELNAVAFGPLAEQLLALGPGAMVAVRGKLAGTTWTGRDGAQRHGLRLTIEGLDHRSGGPPNSALLAAPRPREPAP